MTTRALATHARPRATVLSAPVPRDGAAAGPDPATSVAARVPAPLQRLLRYGPLLWLGGMLYLVMGAVLVRLVITRWPRGLLANAVVLAWLAVGLTQAVASLLNGVLEQNVGRGVRNMFSLTAQGWTVAGLAVAAGAGWQLAGPAAARCWGYLGCHTLLLGAVALVARAAGLDNFQLATPVSLLAGGGDAVRFYATASFFLTENTFGEAATRLVLMNPWAPSLGIGSLGLAFISLRIADARWRAICLAGALLGLVMSWSRLALGAGAAIAVLLLWLRQPTWARAVLAATVMALLSALWAFGLDPQAAALHTQAAVADARAGSSMARDLIYERSWAGFLTSPWIGHGWVGESVHRTEPLPIGSHSSVFGTLYTGGMLVFSAFAVAMAMTLLAVLHRWRSAPDATRRADARVAFALWLVLAAASRYEALYSLSLPCYFVFAWIGGVLASPCQPQAAARHAGPLRHRATGFRPAWERP